VSENKNVKRVEQLFQPQAFRESPLTPGKMRPVPTELRWRGVEDNEIEWMKAPCCDKPMDQMFRGRSQMLMRCPECGKMYISELYHAQTKND